jgi:hypothetical protein
VTVEELDAIVRDHFPLRGTEASLYSLEYVSLVATDEPSSFRIVLRYVVWSVADDGTQSIEDIKEQEIWCPSFGADRARLETFFKAYDRVLGLVFANCARDELVTLMPHDLFDMRALGLARAITEDDFAKALAMKSRLGRFLPPSMRSGSKSDAPALPSVTMSVDELDAIFRDKFPLRHDPYSLEYVSLAPTPHANAFRVTIRIIQWSPGNVIEDVKEQELYCATFGADRARIETFLDAYDYVLGRVFTYAAPLVASLMPHELFDMTALKLDKVRRKDQFEKALAKKSRLGRFLPDNLRS